MATYIMEVEIPEPEEKPGRTHLETVLWTAALLAALGVPVSLYDPDDDAWNAQAEVDRLLAAYKATPAQEGGGGWLN